MAKVTEYIIVDGKKMTIKEWKQSVVEKQKERKGKKRFLKIEKPKKQSKQQKEINAVAIEVDKMLKPMTALKSIQVYKTHAYRSWGNVAKEILAHKGISKPMAQYCVRYGELNELVSEIQKLAKNNEKAAYQYVDKVSWKLDDMKQDILDIIKGVEHSGVCQTFKGHEAIYGKGRQLGLQTIVAKSLSTIGEIENIVKALKDIADNGTDPFHYGDHMSIKAKARCWA